MAATTASSPARTNTPNRRTPATRPPAHDRPGLDEDHPQGAGRYPKVKQDYIAVPCMQCDAPQCAYGMDDAVYQREDGIVMIDPVKAVGEDELVSQCPYRRIYWNEPRR